MQHPSINYSHKLDMKWLTAELQELFNLAILLNDKKEIYGQIAELRAKNGSD